MRTRFSSTLIMDRGILLGATWQSGTACSTWACGMDADVKGDAYEGLLEKNAADVKGAGRDSTLRRVR
ncbi:MAG: hypothetical protein WCD47_09050 [Candidatus Sulfotelmatobacter sp.]